MNRNLNLAREIARLGDRESALTTRRAGFSIAAVVLAVVSVRVVPAAFRETDRADARIVSAAPLAGAAAAALRARVVHRSLGAVSSRSVSCCSRSPAYPGT